MTTRLPRYWLLAGFPLLVLAAIALYYVPPIHDRLAWRVAEWRAEIFYYFNPPEQAVFVPVDQQVQIESIVQATIQSFLLTGPTSTPTPTATPLQATPTPGPTSTPEPSPTPTLTPTPLPDSVDMKVRYEDQLHRWNYCGPSNLSMALNYWGWEGDRDDVGLEIKSNDKDKNVMPYEMVDFATVNAGLGAISRVGGNIDLIKRFLANGFPVLAEKGYVQRDSSGKWAWMGHYQFVTGYDEAGGYLVVQDTYKDGPNFRVPYETFNNGWRDFNYLFIIVYPYEREADVLSLLGDWADEGWATGHALERAQQEVLTLTGVEQFFAAFNVGTSHVLRQSYVDAGVAYDYAFQLYASLPDDRDRPYRMLWYQTGPYFAYYYSGRYQDVVNLATTTLEETIAEPVLEESLYWRGLANLVIGNRDASIQDFRDSLVIHPGFSPSVFQLQQLGLVP